MTHPSLSQADWHRQALHHAIDIICDTWPRVTNATRLLDGYPPGRGYDTSRGNAGIRVDGDTIPATSVEIAAIARLAPHAWVAELHDTTIRVLDAAWPMRAWSIDWPTLRPLLHQAVDTICDTWTLDDLIDADPQSPTHRRDVLGVYRLADRSAADWPPTATKGQTVAGVTVGARTNLVETCAGCGLPVAGGRDDPIKRIDGDPFHANANPTGRWCYHAALRARGKLGGGAPRARGA